MQHKADGYRSPYLRQAVDAGQKDPISRWAGYYQARATLAAAESMRVLARRRAVQCRIKELWEGNPFPDRRLWEGNPFPDPNRRKDSPPTMSRVAAHIDDAVDADSPSFDSAKAAAEINASLDSLKASLAGQGAATGQLVINPCSFTRRVRVDVSKLNQLPAVAAPVVAAAEQRKTKEVVVEVPAMGFAWVGPTEDQAPRRCAAVGSSGGRKRRKARWPKTTCCRTSSSMS